MPDIDERLSTLQAKVDDLEAKVTRLSGPHVELTAGSVGPEGQLVEGPHAEVVIAEGPGPGQTLAEWVAGISGSPGIIYDAGLARSSPCLRMELGEGRKPLVFSKGIIGALDEEQQHLYCQEGYEERQPSERQRQRLEAMHAAAKLCSEESRGADTQEHLCAYFSCLGRELRAKGVEV